MARKMYADFSQQIIDRSSYLDRFGIKLANGLADGLICDRTIVVVSLKLCLENTIMKLKPLFLIPLVCALFLTIGLKGCTIGGESLQSLKVGLNTWPGFDIILYAQEKGLFKERGLDVELVRFENAQDTVRAMMRGSLDMAFVSLWEPMQADPGNDRPTYIMVTNVSKGSDGIVSNSEIQSIADLTGKKVAAKLGTVNHLILLEALKLKNISPQDVTIENVSNERGIEMLKAGEVDAAVVWEPLMSETVKEINGNLVYTTADTDSLVIDGLVTRGSFVESDLKSITQFMLAWFDLMNAVETQPQQVYAVVAEELGQTPESFANDYAGLEKGDIALNQRMFAADGRLQDAIAEITELLKQDDRHGRIIRKDLEIDATAVNQAIETWKP